MVIVNESSLRRNPLNKYVSKSESLGEFIVTKYTSVAMK